MYIIVICVLLYYILWRNGRWINAGSSIAAKKLDHYCNFTVLGVRAYFIMTLR